MQGFEKNRQKLEENSKIIREWIADINNIPGMEGYKEITLPDGYRLL